MLKILIADDHPMILESLGGYLTEIDPDVEVLKACDLPEAVKLLKQHPDLDLVLLDLVMPGMDGYAGFARLEQHNKSVPIVVISAQKTAYNVQQALAAGASGYIPKFYQPQQIVAALRQVLAGGIYLPPELQIEDEAYSLPGFTPRQWQVLGLVTDGCANKVIARELGISESTVKTHVSAILRQLEVQTRAQALAKLRETGMMERSATADAASGSDSTTEADDNDQDEDKEQPETEKP